MCALVPRAGLPGTSKQQSESVSKALEAVRLEWIKKQMHSGTPGSATKA